MKYDRSEIMKRAHGLRRKYGMSMSDALKYAWARTKLSFALKEGGYERIRVHYGLYKNNFAKAVKGTYEEETKTIEIEVKRCVFLNAKLYMIAETIPQVAGKLNKNTERDLLTKIGPDWRKICA
ncbi:MAG: hypothetical protein ACI3X2_09010 [Butyricicoccus porcorum]